jgi:SAM-dependent methyltransferase
MEKIKKSHAVLDLQSRKYKAQKIDMLLDIPRNGKFYKILEVGTGSGGIAHYFATHQKFNIEIDSVDVADCRVVKDGYNFHLVESCILPFADESYDFVISNHVIEHVGEQQEQSVHIAEINRILKPGGAAYLAFPNKWMLIEPHYKLPFLSWIPIEWANIYVKLTGRGDNYDCRPLTHVKVERILNNHKWSFENKSAEALKITFLLERPGSGITKLISQIPIGLIKILNSINPTLIYKISK